MPAVPYTTKTGLQIGKYYQKPNYVEYDQDMLLIQSYLIYDPEVLRKRNLIRFWYGFFIILLLSYLVILSIR
jgi:hypothetical protein